MCFTVVSRALCGKLGPPGPSPVDEDGSWRILAGLALEGKVVFYRGARPLCEEKLCFVMARGHFVWEAMCFTMEAVFLFSKG